MDIQLTAGFGNVQIVFEEFIYCCQCFIIEIIHSQAVQHFFDEHTAQRQRQLIDQTTDTQFFVVHDKFVCFEDLANFQSHFRFLIGTGNVLQIAYDGAAGNINMAVCFRIQCFFDGSCNAVDLFRCFLVTQFFYQNDAVFIHCSYEILCFCRENAAHDLYHVHFLIDICFDQVNDAVYVIFDVQFFRTAIDIHQQQVIQQQIFDEIVFIVSFLICNQQALDLECSDLADLIAGFILTLYLDHIFGHAVIVNFKILIAQDQLAFRRGTNEIFNSVDLTTDHIFFCSGNYLAFLFHYAQFFACNAFQSINGTLQNLI